MCFWKLIDKFYNCFKSEFYNCFKSEAIAYSLIVHLNLNYRGITVKLTTSSRSTSQVITTCYQFDNMQGYCLQHKCPDLACLYYVLTESLMCCLELPYYSMGFHRFQHHVELLYNTVSRIIMMNALGAYSMGLFSFILSVQYLKRSVKFIPICSRCEV